MSFINFLRYILEACQNTLTWCDPFDTFISFASSGPRWAAHLIKIMLWIASFHPSRLIDKRAKTPSAIEAPSNGDHTWRETSCRLDVYIKHRALLRLVFGWKSSVVYAINFTFNEGMKSEKHTRDVKLFWPLW